MQSPDRQIDAMEWIVRPDTSDNDGSFEVVYRDATNVLLAYGLTGKDAHLIAAAPKMFRALRGLVANILEYERINNLSPNPGKQDCWQSMTEAKIALLTAQGKSD